MKIPKALGLVGVLVVPGTVDVHAPAVGARLSVHGVARTEDRPRVLTLLDYYRSGRQSVSDFLARNRAAGDLRGLQAVIRRGSASCALVDIRFGHAEEAYQSTHASGVLIDRGRKLLTAGHGFDVNAAYEIVVTFSGGEARRARLLDHEYQAYGGASRDWAVLEILGSPVTSAPSAVLGEARAGDLAVILGYPDQIGIADTGDVTYAQGALGTALAPLATLATVVQASPLVLTPRAGSVPTGGMSGAPVFDSHGRLIGLFVSVSRVMRKTGVEHAYNAAPLDALEMEIVVP